MKRVLRRPKLAAVVVAAAAAAAITTFGVFGAHGAAPRTGPLVVHAGLERPPAQFVRGDGLYDGKGGRVQLGAPVSGALMGPLSPVAVSSPDGTLVYNSWRELRSVDGERSFSKQRISDGDALGVPSLRVRDGKGRDFLLARGAYSAAWRGDGALAFVRGVESEFRAGRVYQGHVVVQDAIHGRAVAWTSEPARYVVYGWSGERLLFYRIGLGEKLELLVADGPQRVRPLTDGSAIAISQDERRVAVLSQDGTSVRILDIASGRELSWLDVTTTAPSLAWVGYSGSWVGDHVVAPASAGLAIFHVGSNSLELEQVLSLDRAEFPLGVQEPWFSDDTANEIAATADVPPRDGRPGLSFFLQCDRIERTCRRGDAAPAKEWLRPVEGGQQ
jgi:hypothetical protein